MAKLKKNEVAESSPKSELITGDIDLFADAGAGMETMGKDDLQIPRISILQAQSKVCVKKTPEYIKGCEAGHFFNSVDEAWIDGDDGILIIPVDQRLTYIEWGLREDGGGFIADHGNNPDIQKVVSRRNLRSRDLLAFVIASWRTCKKPIYCPKCQAKIDNLCVFLIIGEIVAIDNQYWKPPILQEQR